MPKKIKIAYVIDRLSTDLAGTESQLIKMINGLDREAFQIELICLDNSAWLQQHQSSLGCPSQMIQINGFFKPSAWVNFFALVRVFRRGKPDVVHTFFPVANIIGVLAAKCAGIAHIVSSRRDYGEWMNARYLSATKLVNRYVKKIIANSNPVKRLTLTKEGVNGDTVNVIYNCISTDRFKMAVRDDLLKKRLNIPDHHKIVGIVANFRPMKHHATFIKAAGEILNARQDMSFLLVGTGPLKEECEQLADQLFSRRHTHFVGAQRDVIPYLSIMDIGVNCSEGEGLSNAIMEYMCMGVPCVVSQAGGNPDLITHEQNGFTFPLDDFKTLASLIVKLLDDAPTRKRFAINARGKIEKEMNVDIILSQYEHFYQELLNV